MTTPNLVRFKWADVDGEFAYSTLHVLPNVNPVTLLADIEDGAALFQAVAVGNLIEAVVEIQAYGPFAGAGAAGTYEAVGSWCRLNFETIAGTAASFSFACPLESDFHSSSTVVNEEDAGIAALISWLLGFACDATGRELAEFTGGNYFGT